MNDFPRASPEVCGRHRTAHGTSARWQHQRVATVVCGGLGGIMEAVAKGAENAMGSSLDYFPCREMHAFDAVLPCGPGSWSAYPPLPPSSIRSSRPTVNARRCVTDEVVSRGLASGRAEFSTNMKCLVPVLP
jgi:hypothetical protein